MIKNILIVTRWFYPANTPRAFRATELAKEMSSRGHKVTVLTIKDEKVHDQFSKQFGLEIIDLGRLTWKLPVFGQKGIRFLITRAVHRFFSLLFEFPAIELMYKVQKQLRLVDQYDLLISIAVPYPIHWGVAKARSKKYPIAKTWIADCGDPYMGDKTDSFRKLFYFKYVEKWFMRKADYITIPVEEGKGGYYQEFHHKIRIIPQGFKFKLNQEINFDQNSIPTFAYAGAFIPGVRDPRKFMEFLMAFNGDFVFIVYTQSQHVLQPYITPLADKLILKDYIPREQLLVELGKMDFLVNFDNNTGVQQPSKLIDYTLTGRPIINIYGELDEKVILEFLAGNYENSYKTPNMDKYKIENVVDMFLSLAK